jgi:hypothetical protein
MQSLLSKHEALSSNPSIGRKEGRKEGRRKTDRKKQNIASEHPPETPRRIPLKPLWSELGYMVAAKPITVRKRRLA